MWREKEEMSGRRKIETRGSVSVEDPMSNVVDGLEVSGSTSSKCT